MQVHNYPPTRTYTSQSTSSYTSSSHSRPTSISSIGSTPTLTTSRTSIGGQRPRTRHYSLPDEPPIDEGFFSAPSSRSPSIFTRRSTTMTETSATHASPTFSASATAPAPSKKPKIKPLWKIATGNARSSGGSLDLSQPGGGEAARTLGLGIYGYDELDGARTGRASFSGPLGGGSGVLLPAAAPTTAVSTGYARSAAAHPRRQVPRPYTPSQSYTAANSEHDSSSDDDERGVPFGRGYVSGEFSRGNSIDVSRLPPLRARTDSSTMTLSPALGRAGATFSASSPIISSTCATTTSTGHRSSRRKSKTPSTTREPSPSFVASVTAARAAWDAKEAEKEEKRERKRRKSEQRERERRASRDTPRVAEWNEKDEYTSSTSFEAPPPPHAHGLGSVVDIEVPVEEESEADDDDALPETRYSPRASGVAPRPGSGSTGAASSSRRTTATATARTGSGTGATLKKRWLGFVVWLRIGFVKMGRKLGGGAGKVAAKKR